MASRFEIVDEEKYRSTQRQENNENVKETTKYWKNVMKKWANERNFQGNLEE